MAGDDYFLVIGDLTERELGQYVSQARHVLVRMFVGDLIVDEEFEVDSLAELRPAVESRMAACAKKPPRRGLVESKTGRPAFDPGHALLLPEAEE